MSQRVIVIDMATRTTSKKTSRQQFAPGTRRLQRPTRQVPPYKVIAVGVYDDQAASLDRTAAELQQAGYLKANRSFLIQVLVRRLQQETEGLTSEQLLEMFIENYLKRPLSKVAARTTTETSDVTTERKRNYRTG